MDVYHAWFNLKEGVPDLQFAKAARAYLDRLKEDGRLVAYRITRCKLGLAPPNLREWHITLDFLGLSQLDQAFAAGGAEAAVIGTAFAFTRNVRVKSRCPAKVSTSCPWIKIFNHRTCGTLASRVLVIESTAICSLSIPDGVVVASASEKSAIAVPSCSI